MSQDEKKQLVDTVYEVLPSRHGDSSTCDDITAAAMHVPQQVLSVGEVVVPLYGRVTPVLLFLSAPRNSTGAFKNSSCLVYSL